MSEYRERRKQIVTDRDLQFRIVLAVSWLPWLVLGVTCVVLGVFCKRLADEALALEIELDNVVPLFLTVIAFLIAATAFIARSALKFSSRVAGPIYSLRRTLAQVRGGDLSARAQVRQADFLNGLADDLNECLEQLEERAHAGERREAAPEHAGS